MTTEKSLGDELVRQNRDAPAAAVSPNVEQIVRRQRRQVRWWAVATAALWIVTTLYLLGLLWFYAVFIHPVVNEILDEVHGPDQRVRAIITLLKALLWWPVLLFLAAACTTAFTLASRRATLRQIQASLAEISAQLKELTSSA